MSHTHKTIVPELKHKHENYGNIANVGNAQVGFNSRY